MPRIWPTNLIRWLSIYANSHFTIIASAGENADSGLRGVKDPRARRQHIFNFSGVLLAENIEPLQHVQSTPWHSRAWTFQERALSARVMVFLGDSVFWQCRRNTWLEDQPPALEVGENQSHDSLLTDQLVVSQWPDMFSYCELVQKYNRRHLTFETDALKAFSAIMRSLEPSFPHGFFYGVPEFLFDIGLMWIPVTPLKRRTSFPTWSWAGWAGEIDFMAQGRGTWSPDSRIDRPTRIHPTVKWKKQLNTIDDGYSAIDNGYSIYQNMQATDGWEVCEGPMNQSEVFPRARYTHPLLV